MSELGFELIDVTYDKIPAFALADRGKGVCGGGEKDGVGEVVLFVAPGRQGPLTLDFRQRVETAK